MVTVFASTPAWIATDDLGDHGVRANPAGNRSEKAQDAVAFKHQLLDRAETLTLKEVVLATILDLEKVIHDPNAGEAAYWQWPARGQSAREMAHIAEQNPHKHILLLIAPWPALQAQREAARTAVRPGAWPIARSTLLSPFKDDVRSPSLAGRCPNVPVPCFAINSPLRLWLATSRVSTISPQNRSSLFLQGALRESQTTVVQWRKGQGMLKVGRIHQESGFPRRRFLPHPEESR